MELYTFFRSSTSFRLRIALAYKGMAWEPRYVSLPKGEHRAPDYLAKNPQGLVPALVDEAGRVFTQSMAMIEYLDDIQPEPPLMPKGAEDKWYVRAVSQIIGCEMHPLNNVRVLKYLKGYGLDDAKVNGDWYPHWIAEGFSSLEAFLLEQKRFGDVLPGCAVHHGRRLPDSAGVQRAALQLRPRGLSDRHARIRGGRGAGGGEEGGTVDPGGQVLRAVMAGSVEEIRRRI